VATYFQVFEGWKLLFSSIPQPIFGVEKTSILITIFVVEK
jgi:hypothetical protein